jgi:hypothetical protein
MSAAERKVHFTQDAGLGVITLDSPPLNQIGEELIGDLTAALDQVEAAEGLRALMLRAMGLAMHRRGSGATWSLVRVTRTTAANDAEISLSTTPGGARGLRLPAGRPCDSAAPLVSTAQS